MFMMELPGSKLQRRAERTHHCNEINVAKKMDEVKIDSIHFGTAQDFNRIAFVILTVARTISQHRKSGDVMRGEEQGVVGEV